MNRLNKFLLFCFICLSSSVVLAQNKDLSYNYIPEDMLKNCDAVIRIDNMDIEIISQDLMKIKTSFAITVINESGDHYSRVVIPYDKHTTIKKVKTTIYNEAGEKIKTIKKSKFRDYSAVSSGTLYSDSRVLAYVYISPKYPYTIYNEQEIVTSNTFSIPRWVSVSGYNTSVEESSYKLKSLKNKFMVKTDNFEDPNINYTATDTEINIKLKNIKPMKGESMSGSFMSKVPNIQVSLENFNLCGVQGTAKNWSEYGKWFNDNLLNDSSIIDQKTLSEIDELTKDISSDREKAKLVYEYVQTKMRYISVQVGIGGFQPITADIVDKASYGDCKGLSNYTKRLLEYVKVPAYFAFVKAGSTGKGCEETFSSMTQFNHVVLYLPMQENNEIWLECTSKDSPFGYVSNFTDDRNVFIPMGEDGKVMKTPSYESSENSRLTNADINIDEYGNIEAKVSINTKGILYGNHYFLKDRDPDYLNKYYKKNYWHYLSNAEIKNISFDNDKDNIEFTEKLDVNISNYIGKVGDDNIICLNIFDKDVYNPSKYRNRKFGLKIRRGYTKEASYNIKTPVGYKINIDDSSRNLESEFGSYSSEITETESGKYIYKRKLVINKGDYPKEKYKVYSKFLKTIKKMDNTKLLLSKI